MFFVRKSFTRSKHVGLKKIFKVVHIKKAIFSESIVSKIYLEFSRISKDQQFKFSDFNCTVEFLKFEVIGTRGLIPNYPKFELY